MPLLVQWEHTWPSQNCSHRVRSKCSKCLWKIKIMIQEGLSFLTLLINSEVCTQTSVYVFMSNVSLSLSRLSVEEVIFLEKALHGIAPPLINSTSRAISRLESCSRTCWHFPLERLIRPTEGIFFPFSYVPRPPIHCGSEWQRHRKQNITWADA